ncbi:putative RNA helicase aquarius [Blattamonas nauphoetae]|uniref:RNA helicase aquarius n=1 Tax=Blattamonas nauphoetae TaxID=2049346 RepID=A0ABQ9WUD5_9EUKA|nr:putative RNA helicase aquarius [Blattamonas nauphoetae]
MKNLPYLVPTAKPIEIFQEYSQHIPHAPTKNKQNPHLNPNQPRNNDTHKKTSSTSPNPPTNLNLPLHSFPPVHLNNLLLHAQHLRILRLLSHIIQVSSCSNTKSDRIRSSHADKPSLVLSSTIIADSMRDEQVDDFSRFEDSFVARPTLPSDAEARITTKLFTVAPTSEEHSPSPNGLDTGVEQQIGADKQMMEMQDTLQTNITTTDTPTTSTSSEKKTDRMRCSSLTVANEMTDKQKSLSDWVSASHPSLDPSPSPTLSEERPTVQNAALRIGAGFGQSLFHRLLRLHVPFLPLTAQGLCKPSISRLLTRVYPNLTNTARVSQPPLTISNAGLGLDFQFVHVEGEGEGEVEQAAFFIENTEEARFAVELFKYLRLIGHPPHSISILTPYNGQRALIRDIVQRECAAHKDFGRPHKITTISCLEGCKDDIIILSLVRTTNPGRLSEQTEIVGAVPSARHGLYVLGRTELVENTPALKRVLGPVIMKANALVIEPTEKFEGHERLTTQPADQQRIQFMKNSAQLAKINSVLMGAR